MTNLIGQSLGRYHILEQLGEGGMATVYKAYDTRLERDVAVKVIRRGAFPLEQSDRILKRFEREAKALAKLSHLHIIKVIDYGEYEGSPYLVMEYMPGGTLKSRLGKPIPWQEVARILIPIAEALEYAHEHNIIHRDIKPSNILLTEKGQPMLTDFGIAKILESETETATLTGTGIGIGTPEYMAPEQWTGQAVSQSDIYSLGVVLYEMVTGRKPYEADTPASILLKQATAPLPRPGKFARDLPDAVERLLLKALAMKVESRFATMAEFSTALRGMLVGKDLVSKTKEKPVKIEKNSRKPTSKPILKPMAFVLGLIAFGALVFGMFSFMSNPGTELATATSVQANTSISNQATRTPSNPMPSATLTLVVTETTSTISTEPPLSLQTELTDDMGVKMALVPAGEFIMGSNSEYSSPDARPGHRVNLNAFYIDIYEVTNNSYQNCVDAGECEIPKNTDHFNNPKYSNHPVVFIDWSMAKTFCEWREARLPTEAEWEKSARGTDARNYPWGYSAWGYSAHDCSFANTDWARYPLDYCVGDTTSVGNYEIGKSQLGVYDLTGNVWEWIADWYDYDYYLSSPNSNPLGPDSGNRRVARGGSWLDGVYYFTYDRHWFEPNYAGNSVGFRCARPAP